jgi:N-methylhydantoinase A/oxoprolinase/acetone carboxylase beta subunit
LLLHEFFSLVRDISGSSNYTEEEKAFCEALKGGPLIYSEAAAAIGKDIYSLKVQRLEREGVVMRCGLTPTDIMHIRGDFKNFCTDASIMGAQFVASCIGTDVDSLCSMVYDRIKKTLYCNIVRMLLEDKFPYFKKHGLDHGLETVVAESWEMTKDPEKQAFLGFKFDTPATLVGIGAPIHIFLPDVAKALGTKCIVPGHAGVANALGAIIGNISAVSEIEIKPDYSAPGCYTVYGKSCNYYVRDQEEAVRLALEEAKAAARAEAESRGATGDISVSAEVVSDTFQTEANTEVCFGIKAVAKAVGRITL